VLHDEVLCYRLRLDRRVERLPVERAVAGIGPAILVERFAGRGEILHVYRDDARAVAIKPGGRLATTVMPEFREDAKAKGISLEGFTAQAYTDDLEQIGELIDNGDVSPIVSAVMSLEDARKAEELSGKHHTRGKVVIKVI